MTILLIMPDPRIAEIVQHFVDSSAVKVTYPGGLLLAAHFDAVINTVHKEKFCYDNRMYGGVYDAWWNEVVRTKVDPTTGRIFNMAEGYKP